MDTKNKNIHIKEFTAKTTDNGSIEGYASTWDREPDSYGDIVARGAFTETLKEWKDSGRAIPFLWSHGMHELDAFIGKAEADEDDRGLHFIATFDDTPDAQRVRQLYQDGRLAKFSFAYETLESAEITLPDGRKANELRKLRLYEISAVTVPANSHAEVTDVKAADEDEKNPVIEAIEALGKTITDAVASLADIIKGETGEDAKDNDDADETKATPAEEPKTANAERKAALLDIIKTITNKEETK